MALIENIIGNDGSIMVRDKVQVAIQRLKSFEPDDGYWLAFSGGKDSVVIKALADMANVKYEAHYSLTTVDPPELVRFVKTFPDVIIDRPKETMWQLIVKSGMPPTRLARYCCLKLKESSGVGKITITGVRWAESVNRKNNQALVRIGASKKGSLILNDENDESRRIVENCYRTKKTLVNPIIDWSDEDVWEFIKKHNIKYCELYDKGYERLGCIGCPMNTKRTDDFERYPKYKESYIRAFDKMIVERNKKGLVTKNYKTGRECFDWWIGLSDKESDQYDGQMELEQ